MPGAFAMISMPAWVWGNHPAGFLEDARLYCEPQSDGETFRVAADEQHYKRRHANLIDLITISRPDRNKRDRWERLSQIPDPVELDPGPEFLEALEQLEKKHLASSDLVDMINHAQAQIAGIGTKHLGEQTKYIAEWLRSVNGPDGAPGIFADASVHFVHRHPELISRLKLPAVILRFEAGLQLTELANQPANSREVIFAAAQGLQTGLYISDTYLRPLLGALTPAVWGFTAVRSKGLIVFSLGRAINGAPGGSTELLQLLTSSEHDRTPSYPNIDAQSISAALEWWVDHLDQAMSYVSDPAVHVDGEGTYSAIRQLEAALSLEQLFRSMSSLQGAYRDANAARTLAFATLDSLHTFTGRSLEEMTDVRAARRTLDRVNETMSPDAARVLLPNAERGVKALDEVASGFFVRRQTHAADVKLKSIDFDETLPPNRAAAHYIKVIRNAAMHGHLGSSAGGRARAQALLSNHDGGIPPDLSQIAWLHFLDFLANPEQVRRRLVRGGRRA